MANISYPLNESSAPIVFVANQSGPIARTDAGGRMVTCGLVLLNSPTALALTLGDPKAGPPSLGGEDGNRLELMVVSDDGYPDQSHTVTGTFGGGFTTLTFLGQSGITASLIAYGGKWWKLIASAGLS
jgi:hypothetical protein